MKIVYHEKFKEVYSSDPAAAPGRIESIYDELKKSLHEFVEVSPANEEDILLVHSRDYIERVTELPSAYKIALLAAGDAKQAADIAMEGEPAFGLIRPPGHHASRTSSWGFCYFNNIAVAIEGLRIANRIKRALIIDTDLHYGDGTANIFSSSANITYFHPEAYNRLAYLGEIKRFLDITHDPFDILAVSAGFDRHEQDWGGMLKTEDYCSIAKMLMDFAASQCNGRRFAVLEGGYNHTVLGKNVKSFLDGLK